FHRSHLSLPSFPTRRSSDLRQRSLVQVQLGPRRGSEELMKKFITTAAVLLGTSIAGVLTWRKIESDRTRNDLWTEAEQAFAAQDTAATQDQPATSARA